jgi:hypothetical protein
MAIRATDPGRTIELRIDPHTTVRLHRDADGRAWGRLFTWRDESAAFEADGPAEEIDLADLLRSVCDHLTGPGGDA